MNHKDDLKSLAAGRPFIRSVLAYMAFLRFGGTGTEIGRATIDSCYEMADEFLSQLEEDLGAH